MTVIRSGTSQGRIFVWGALVCALVALALAIDSWLQPLPLGTHCEQSKEGGGRVGRLGGSWDAQLDALPLGGEHCCVRMQAGVQPLAHVVNCVGVAADAAIVLRSGSRAASRQTPLRINR